MKTTRLHFLNTLLRILGIVAVAILIGKVTFTHAQDLPIALEKKSDLSPRNKKDFAILVNKYKTAVCFDGTPGCVRSDVLAVEARDALIYATISQIDLNFSQYQRNVRHRKAIFETLMDFLKLGADTAAVISNGSRAKTIITASSALVQLLRESTEKNLRLKETQILFNKMETNRFKVLAMILTKIRGDNSLETPLAKKGIADYPFDAAWVDLVAYYRAGTLDTALSDLASDTADERRNEEKKVTLIKAQ